MKTALKNLVAAAICTASAGALPAWAETKLSMATSWPGGVLLEYAQGFADRVELMTNGEVVIEVFPGGTLGSPMKVAETVRNGVAEVGHSSPVYEYGLDKTNALLGGRPGGLSAEVMHHWLSQGGGLELWREYRMDAADVVSFPCYYAPMEAGMFSTKRVQTVEDFDGLKLRTAGAWAEIAAGLGVSTVVLPGAEVYQALERGVVDSVEWGGLAMNQQTGFHKIAPYIIQPGIHQRSLILECSFNTDVWSSLSERNQRMIELAAVLEAHHAYESTGHQDAEAYGFFKEQGVEFVTVDDDVLAKVADLIAAWEDKTAADQGGWFARILQHQRDYQDLWANAKEYRD